MRRLCQARLRQRGEQYVAEAGRSTPTVQDAPHSGQLAVTPTWTASVLPRARRIRRQCRDRHADEHHTAVAFAAGISGPPHPRHNRGPMSSSTTTTSRRRGTPSLSMQPRYDWGERSPRRLSSRVRHRTQMTSSQFAHRVQLGELASEHAHYDKIMVLAGQEHAIAEAALLDKTQPTVKCQ